MEKKDHKERGKMSVRKNENALVGERGERTQPWFLPSLRLLNVLNFLKIPLLPFIVC